MDYENIVNTNIPYTYQKMLADLTNLNAVYPFLEVSSIGEILKKDFYSYDAKYVNSINTIIDPIDIDNKIKERIRRIAKKAYRACNCRGLSRVDFFLTKDNKIYLNEINTMPGFTNISMYPKLMEYYGYSIDKLIDKLISIAI